MTVGAFGRSHKQRNKYTPKKVPVKVDQQSEDKSDKTLKLAVEQFLDFLDNHTRENKQGEKQEHKHGNDQA